MRTLLAVALAALATTARAATFVVTSSAAAGPGTLTQAILDANANPGRDTITFAVDGSGFNLPPITGPVDIDGTLPGGSRAVIEGAGAGNGFVFAAGSDGSTLQDVRLVRMSAAGGVVVQTGVTDVGIFRIDSVNVRTFGRRTTIGRVGDGNVITTLLLAGDSNTAVGNELIFANTSGPDHSVAHNRIRSGLSADDAVAVTIENNIVTLTNHAIGISVRALPGRTNIVRNNTVEAGSIGIDVVGPVQVSRNAVWNNDTGIGVRGNAVELDQNTIAGGVVAIDLGLDGPTPNDPAPDADTGANNRQNFPLLATARRAPGGVTITGTLASAPSTPYEIQFFSSPASDPKAHVFVGATNVTTDAAGNVSFQVLFTTNLPAAGNVITATATNRGSAATPGNAPNETSELSAPVVVTDIAAEAIPTLPAPMLLVLLMALVAVLVLRN